METWKTPLCDQLVTPRDGLPCVWGDSRFLQHLLQLGRLSRPRPALRWFSVWCLLALLSSFVGTGPAVLSVVPKAPAPEGVWAERGLAQQGRLCQLRAAALPRSPVLHGAGGFSARQV